MPYTCNHEITLDTKLRKATPLLAVNGDTANKIKVHLTENGQAINLTNLHVRVVFKRSDNRVVLQTEDDEVDPVQLTEATGIVEFILKNGSFRDGENQMEVQILSGDGRQTLITSANARIIARKQLLTDEATEASVEFPMLQALVDALRNMDLTITTLSPGASATGTITLSDGVYHLALGIPKGDTIASIDVVDGYLVMTMTDGGTLSVHMSGEIENAVTEWLDLHPEATTTVQDGSLTVGKFADALKLLTVKDYITPEMYGAIGDGITDDYASITQAVAAANSLNKPLLFTEGRAYLTSQPIVIATIPKEVKMLGYLKYTGADAVLTLGTTTGVQKNRRIIVRVSGGLVSGSVGVKFINLSSCYIELSLVENSENGALFYGYNYGVAYNNVIVGEIRNCKYGVHLLADGDGYVNENKFTGGRIHCDSNVSYSGNNVGIFFEGSSTNPCNGNIFYSTCFEEAGTGVKLVKSSLNRVYDCRTEGVVNAVLDADESSYDNVVTSLSGRSAEGSFKIYNESNVFNDGYFPIINNFRVKVFDSGNIGENLAANADRVAYANLQSVYNGRTFVYSGTRVAERTAAGLKMTGLGAGNNDTGTVGCRISTDINKTFLIEAAVSGKSRLAVFLYDANGDLITNADVYSLYVDNSADRQKLTYSSGTGRLGGGYLSQSTVEWRRRIIVLPEACKSAWVGLCAYKASTETGTTFTLKRLTIYGKNIENYYTTTIGTSSSFVPATNANHAVLDSIPTSEGFVGQYVMAETPSASLRGWICTGGTNWIAV